MSESDQSDYYSDSDSESQISENVIKDKAEPEKNAIVSKNIKAFDDEDEEEDDEIAVDDDEDDDVVDEGDDVDLSDQDDSQTGGADEMDSDSDRQKKMIMELLIQKLPLKKIKILLNPKTRQI